MSSKAKPYFPIFVDLTDRKIVVAGAGTIAKRRIRVLADFTEHLVVIAPEVNPELKKLEAAGKITVLRKTCEAEDLEGAALVIAAMSDNKVNQEIHEACKRMGIPVNVCSDRAKCDFFFPSIASGGGVVAGISASGRMHGKARETVDQIQKILEMLEQG